MRIASKNTGFQGFDLGKATQKIKKMAELNKKYMPPLKLPQLDMDTLKNFNAGEALSMVNKAKEGLQTI